jgi:hypothetical protein
MEQRGAWRRAREGASAGTCGVASVCEAPVRLARPRKSLATRADGTYVTLRRPDARPATVERCADERELARSLIGDVRELENGLSRAILRAIGRTAQGETVIVRATDLLTDVAADTGADSLTGRERDSCDPE